MHGASWVGARGPPHTPGSLRGQASAGAAQTKLPGCPRPRGGPRARQAAPAHPRGACRTGMPDVFLRCHVTLPGSPWPRPSVESSGEEDTALPGGGTRDVSPDPGSFGLAQLWYEWGPNHSPLMQQQSSSVLG